MRHELEPVGEPTVYAALRRWGGDVTRVRQEYRCKRCGQRFAPILLAGEPYDTRFLGDCQEESADVRR